LNKGGGVGFYVSNKFLHKKWTIYPLWKRRFLSA
jgi:hypothetical protein